MNKSEITRLLGSTIYKRARDYQREGAVYGFKRTQTPDDVWHISASVEGNGSRDYDVDLWMRKDGALINATCSCPYNEEGSGPLCKHIGAVLLEESEHDDVQMATPSTNPMQIPGVMSGKDYAAKRSNNYNANLNMMFGKKWREDEPETDSDARYLLNCYEDADREAQENQQSGDGNVAAGSIDLTPELTIRGDVNATKMILRVKISNGGRRYVVKDIAELLSAINKGFQVSYGKQLAFRHCMEAFDEKSKKLLDILNRQINILHYAKRMIYGYAPERTDKVDSLDLSSDLFDDLFELYYADGMLDQYFLEKGMPELTLHALKAKGGVKLTIEPTLNRFEGVRYAYLCSEDAIYRVPQSEYRRIKTVLEKMNGKKLFFTQKDTSAFCSYILPELGDTIRIDDPQSLLLNQIPLKPVVQFYLDVPREMTLSAHAEFLYGEDKVTPFVPPKSTFLRDPRTEKRTAQLLECYMEPMVGNESGIYETTDEDSVYRFLEEGIPALMAAGEVYLSDAFRNLQVPAPKISVGVSVHGSVLDLDVDTGEFPAAELKELLRSLRQKKRYHRLRDGRLLRLDDSMEVLDELNETLELSGAKLGQTHAELPLYRAPSLDSALAGNSAIRFNRDDSFRRIIRSFHSVQDSEYAPPVSLQGVLRKYQRDGYRWLRTLDSYGMGGILADDMGLGKTLQVLTYLLAIKEEGQTMPSLIVCPASLVLNWEEECHKFTPQLRCLTMDGNAAHRADLAAQFSSYDLIVTSYDLLRRDSERYEEQAFYACILDEAQAIKNHVTQKYRAVCRVNSKVRFALTGTPVENRLSELWSIFSFLMPGYLYSYKNFCDRFEKPIVQDEDENAVHRLNQLTGPFLLRRMKADVLKELPPKIENVYHVNLGEEQRKLYLAAVLEAKEKLRAADPNDRMAVFAVLMRLRQICCDPRLIADNWTGGSAKLDACADLVSSAVEGGHRVLLFSQFTSMLSLLEEKLDELKISHFKLEGSTPKPVRAQLVHRFNAGEVSVFLISLRAGGTGLNLTAADVVIHYDPWWNVAAQNQATDRAYRIGQQNTVQVYKLIAQDTVENKILALQESKENLAQNVAGNADGAIMSMRPEELLELLDS